jgi:hypothetical protein
MNKNTSFVTFAGSRSYPCFAKFLEQVVEVFGKSDDYPPQMFGDLVLILFGSNTESGFV